MRSPFVLPAPITKNAGVRVCCGQCEKTAVLK